MTKKQKERMTAAFEEIEAVCMSSTDCKGCPAKIGKADCVRWSIWSTNKHQSDLKKYGDEEDRKKEPCKARFEQ